MDPTRVQVEVDEWCGGVDLLESTPGGSDWSVVGVEVSARDGSPLSAARLRAVPWGQLFDQARASLEGAVERSSLLSPSDVRLRAFATDRRGKAARSDRDYAELALAYLTFGQERRHKAASHWASKYGRTAQRWRMDIKRAKDSYLEVTGDGALRLTDDAWVLIFGDGIWEILAVEGETESLEEEIARLESLGDGSAASAEYLGRLRRKARKIGVSVPVLRDELLRRRRQMTPD